MLTAISKLTVENTMLPNTVYMKLLKDEGGTQKFSKAAQPSSRFVHFARTNGNGLRIFHLIAQKEREREKETHFTHVLKY